MNPPPMRWLDHQPTWVDIDRGCLVVHEDVDDTWSARGYFWHADHAWRLGELRIFPRHAHSSDPRVEFDQMGAQIAEQVVAAAYPDHPLTPARLKDVERLLRQMQQRVNDDVPELRTMAKRRRKANPESEFWRHLEDLPSSTSDLPSLSEAQLGYLRVAWLYTRKSTQMANPNPAIAQELGLSGPERVRDMLRFARQQGFLESGGARRAGGRLTPKGAALVKRYDIDEESK